MPPSEREAEVLAALRPVIDPELDESVVDLGFIARVAVKGNRAAVDFRLPTFWCSANFAWIMAEDMSRALAALPWLAGSDIRLVDHFASKKVSEGVAAGRSFREAFGDEAAANLDAIRETFRRKAYLGRMARLIEALRERDWSDARIAGAAISDIRQVAAAGDTDASPAASRYLELRAVYGGASAPSDAAFRKPDGEAIAVADFPAWLRDIRMTRRGVEANGEMCRILLKARNEEPAPAES
jgi:metal-sulfur cluster biosynthetic enzyme